MLQNLAAVAVVADATDDDDAVRGHGKGQGDEAANAAAVRRGVTYD